MRRLQPIPATEHYCLCCERIHPDCSSMKCLEDYDAVRPLSDADILADYQDYPLEERGILAGRELARRLDAGCWTLGAAV